MSQPSELPIDRNEDEDVGGASGGRLGDEGQLTKKRGRQNLKGDTSDEDLDAAVTFGDKENASLNSSRHNSPAKTTGNHQDTEDDEDDEDDENDEDDEDD